MHDDDNGIAAFLRDVFTPPMSKSEIAEAFDVGRHHAGAVLKSIDDDDKRQIGSRWRIRLSQMPPSYIIASGLTEIVSG